MRISGNAMVIRFVSLLIVAVTLLNTFEVIAAEVTLRGSVVCNGACIPDPKTRDHGLVIFAIDGTPEIQVTVDQIVQNFSPDQGLDAVAAQKMMDEFTKRVKYYIDPESPALKDAKNQGENHYCMPATASAVTGTVFEKDGKRWITADKIESVSLRFPDKLLTPDKPLVRPSRDPLILKVGKGQTLRCVHIPAGTFLMGTPVYMWPYHVEEYPHVVTLTRDFYMSEIPVTQEMFETLMEKNPSVVKDPQLPVQNPTFADLKMFCQLLSDSNGCKVRLPTSAEWEYAARVGTSNPGFAEKFKDQNSSGPDGYRSPLKVKSKQPNAWGLYDMASCWWEITGDRGMYHVRHSITDPHYPPGNENSRSQRTGRGIVDSKWSIGTHEFITEKADYAGQKFRIVVEIPARKAED